MSFDQAMRGALGCGVTISLALDAHGKSLSYLMQDVELPVQEEAEKKERTH